MQPDVIFLPRDLGGIGATANDRGDDDGVSAHAGCGCKNDAVPHTEARVGRELLVHSYASRCAALQRNREQAEKRKNQDVRACAAERACLAQRAVSLTASRVSSSVYDGSLNACMPRLMRNSATPSSSTPVTSAPIHM
jgi:hypothetical protein